MESITGDILVKFSDSKTAEIFFTSLQPETLKSFTDRSSISIERDDDTIRFLIDAKDVTAFRATVNSYLIWMRALFSVSTLL